MLQTYEAPMCSQRVYNFINFFIEKISTTSSLLQKILTQHYLCCKKVKDENKSLTCPLLQIFFCNITFVAKMTLKKTTRHAKRTAEWFCNEVVVAE
jgi:hypothetical protein